MPLKIHWRILVAATLVLVIAAFVAPRLFPAPDLNENRTLAAMPAWPARLSGLETYRKDLDAYVADHFPARAQLISLLNYVRIPLGVTGSKRVIVGRDGWLFYNDDTLMGGARGDPRLGPSEVQAWLSNFAARTEALRARNIPYVLVIAPNKETIYPEFGPVWYDGPAPDRTSMRLTQLAAASGAGEVVHLYTPLMAAKAAGATTYSRHDTHWTGEGAYAGYVALMARLKAMGVTQEGSRPRAAFQVITEGKPDRDLAHMLGVGGLVTLDYPRLGVPAGDPPIRIDYLSDLKNWTGPRVVETGQVGKPTALLTVDSFSNALLPFLYSHFSRLIIAHNQDGYWRTDLIDRFKPDVVILEIIESGTQHTMSPAPVASPEAVARIDAAIRKADPSAPPPIDETGLEKLASDSNALKPFLAATPVKACNPEESVIATGAAGRRLKAGGWISDLGPTAPRGEGALRLSGPGGEYLARIRVDVARPDVAAHFSAPSAGRSGYGVELPADAVAPGVYQLSVYLKVGARWMVCSGTPSVTAP